VISKKGIRQGILMSWLAIIGLGTYAHASEPASQPDVVQLRLSFSNMYLIKSAKPVLIDGGSSADVPALTEGLAAQGLKLQDVALVVLTHSHSDHAGMAAELQRAGIKVAIGEGDVPMAKAGHNDDLKPTNFTAFLLKHFAINPKFEPYTPDFVVKDRFDLRPWGIEGHAQQMPGHTPGSLVVHLDDGRTFVGDMFLGGYMGGRISPHKAGEHYFQANGEQNLRNIQTLLKQPIKTFYLGHGGPVDRASVEGAFGK
jgi:hydroxyacylglutathione hydrolase